MTEDEDPFDGGSPLTLLNMSSSCYTVQQETLEGENFCKFRGFVGICKSFHCKICGRGNFWRHQCAICESFHRKICGRGNFWRRQRAICESFLHEKFVFDFLQSEFLGQQLVFYTN